MKWYGDRPDGRSFFFFNDTATTEIYTLSLHDALPISALIDALGGVTVRTACVVSRINGGSRNGGFTLDRKSTRLNSSHANISYAAFCLKKTTTAIRSSPPSA